MLEDCVHWTGRALAAEQRDVTPTTTPPEVGAAQTRLLRLPWTGNSFGLQDARFVTACNRTTLVGIVGPFNSGKTTLLALIYLLLQNGERAALGSFAGSASFVGWENLANKLRWKPDEGGPTFPSHTSRSAGRCPGLLHLSFRDNINVRHDFLLTDPPGEWFNAWAQMEQAPGADGARWIQQYADKFVVLVDRDALSSSTRGQARDSLRDLARRLSRDLRHRPIAVVWTKSDKLVSPTIESDLRECFAQEFPGHEEFFVRMRFGNETREEVEDPCLKLVNWIFTSPERSRAPFSLPVQPNSDPFFAYRGDI